MHIGLDLQTLRWPEGGLFFFAWNLYSAFKEVNVEHRITPILYGHDRMIEADAVRDYVSTPPASEMRYYWDGPRPHILASWFRQWKPQPPWVVRQIDRRLMLPLWIRACDSSTIQGASRLARRFGLRDSLYRGIDLVHHFNYIVLPIHSGANVLTIADLTTLRVPEFHTQGTRDWQQSAYTHARQMDLVLTISEHSKKDVVDLLGVCPDRVRVIPLAAHSQYRRMDDQAEIDKVRARYEIDSRPYLISIATLEPRKNHCRLIESFHELLKRESKLEHLLVLVGAKGWLFEPIFETIQRLGLESRVRWLDYVPFADLPALLNGADLFVYPSLYEGFGLPPLEAMACGTPVIASNTTSLPEVVGEAGLLVDPTSVPAITDAMQHVLLSDGTRNVLRCKGLARAKEFSWHRTAQLTLAAYEDAYQMRQANKSAQNRFRYVHSAAQKEIRRWVIVRSAEYAKRVIHPIGF